MLQKFAIQTVDVALWTSSPVSKPTELLRRSAIILIVNFKWSNRAIGPFSDYLSEATEPLGRLAII